MAGAGTSQETALGSSAPKRTIKVMKEAERDGPYVGKHLFLLHIRCELPIYEGADDPRLLLRTPGDGILMPFWLGQRARP